MSMHISNRFKLITIKNVPEEKVLGITIDNELTFKRHLKGICEKANQKLNAPARITKFTSPFQRKTLLNSFIKSQFSYCSLIWMFTSKGLNEKINRIHEKSLRLFLNDHQSTLDEMLDTLNGKTIHEQCIDRLLTEVSKFLNGYSPDIMNNVFHLRQNTYNLRNVHAFATDVPRNNCMLNAVVYRANQLWKTLPLVLKNSCSLELFKIRIKKLAVSSGKWSGPGPFLKAQGNFFLSFLCALFYIFLTPKNYKSSL